MFKVSPSPAKSWFWYIMARGQTGFLPWHITKQTEWNRKVPIRQFFLWYWCWKEIPLFSCTRNESAFPILLFSAEEEEHTLLSSSWLVNSHTPVIPPCCDFGPFAHSWHCFPSVRSLSSFQQTSRRQRWCFPWPYDNKILSASLFYENCVTWDWKDDSEIESTYCSCRGPGFSF